jgi:hypothetical protein
MDEPWQQRSPAKQDKFNTEANKLCAAFLEPEFAPALSQTLKDLAGEELSVEDGEQSVLIQYPHSFSLSAILPQIRLEIGPLASWIPNEHKEIRSYAAEKFPHLFSQSSTIVSTVAVHSTFWVKATILHQEAHRASGSPLPNRYSRHYYDLFRLSKTLIRDKALADLDLLQSRRIKPLTSNLIGYTISHNRLTYKKMSPLFRYSSGIATTSEFYLKEFHHG